MQLNTKSCTYFKHFKFLFFKDLYLLCGYQTPTFVSDNASKCQKATTWAGEMAPWVACPASLDPGNLCKKAGKVCSCL